MTALGVVLGSEYFDGRTLEWLRTDIDGQVFLGHRDGPTGVEVVLMALPSAILTGSSFRVGEFECSVGDDYSLSSDELYTVLWGEAVSVLGSVGKVGGATRIETHEVQQHSGPTSYSLLQNAPNPFNPVTTITYSIPKTTHVQLRVYNVSGGLVRELVNEVESSAQRSVIWDGRNTRGDQVASGVYFYELVTDDFRASKKFVVAR